MRRLRHHLLLRLFFKRRAAALPPPPLPPPHHEGGAPSTSAYEWDALAAAAAKLRDFHSLHHRIGRAELATCRAVGVATVLKMKVFLLAQEI
jgi:hypothetical protein